MSLFSVTKTLLSVTFALTIIAVTAPRGHATILTFDGLGQNVAIPDTFGDNITAAETGISVANGTTPNIDLTWSGVTGGSWQFYNDAFSPPEWTGAQMDGYDDGDFFDILFTPDAGFAVLVDSFVFDDYAGFAAGNDFTWTLFQTNDTGSVIGTGNETTTNGQNLTVPTGMSTAFAGPVLLRVSGVSPVSNQDQALDTISFTQSAVVVAVPEATSCLSISMFAGVTMLIARRRRKRHAVS